jgi:hypothetical protein
MRSERYFQNPERTQEALARYARFARQQGWPISEKLGLYRHASTAFAGTADERTRRASHEEVYWSLRSWWKVGRRGTLWDAGTVFDVLTGQCQACCRGSGLDLTRLEDHHEQQSVVTCLETVRNLKRLRSGNYPIMAVSKNLHFYNPRLFVIYDNEVVVGHVYRVFKKDWSGCYRRFASTGDRWLDFYLAYLLWASRSISTGYRRLMDDFAEWFIEAVRGEGEEAEDLREELRLSYATAFEFIVIGAAHLEGAPVPCQSASQ